MTPDPRQVIVNTEDYAAPFLHLLCVHHRDFPELRAEGESPRLAAAHLADRLTLTLDNVPSGWRREIVERALEDVRAFAQQ